MLRSTRHTVVLSALVLSLIAAPATFAGPAHSFDHDFGIRASIEAFLTGLSDLFEDFYGDLAAEDESPWTVTIQKAGPTIQVNGDTEPSGAAAEDDTTSSALPGPTENLAPTILVNG